MTEIELKPCPFCGGKVDFNFNIELIPDGIRCMNCRAFTRFFRVGAMKQKETFGELEERMAELWNRRAGDDGEE